ncbi:hypothetical protein [Citrobacter werkmanii]|nr:hypothetical protein [Citrobacter werkmanii]
MRSLMMHAGVGKALGRRNDHGW